MEGEMPAGHLIGTLFPSAEGGSEAVRDAAEAEAEEARMSPTAPYHFGLGGADAGVGDAALATSHTGERPQEGLGDPGTGQLGPDPWNGQRGEATAAGERPVHMADAGQENPGGA